MTTENQAPEGGDHHAVMRQALQALENSSPHNNGAGWIKKHHAAKRALQDALAAQLQAAPTTPEGEPLGAHLLRLARKHDLSADFLAAIRQAAELLAAQPQAAPAITEAEIDRVAALTEKAMEEGLRGFCRTWGWQQFARTLVENLRPYGLRITPKEPTSDR